MAATLPDRRLRLHLQPTSEEVYEPDYLRETPLIRFAAYQADHRLFGWVRLDADRLTDLLNACESVSLENLEIADFDRGSIRNAERASVQREELVAIHASGPRGNEGKRRPTSTASVAVSSGNYLISGRLHVPGGLDPLTSWAERPPMVPLTEATIEYWLADERLHRSTGTIIVNRDRAEGIRVLGDASRSRRNG